MTIHKRKILLIPLNDYDLNCFYIPFITIFFVSSCTKIEHESLKHGLSFDNDSVMHVIMVEECPLLGIKLKHHFIPRLSNVVEKFNGFDKDLLILKSKQGERRDTCSSLILTRIRQE